MQTMARQMQYNLIRIKCVKGPGKREAQHKKGRLIHVLKRYLNESVGSISVIRM